ncbi:hypothetical protein P4T54_29920 [Bacillus mycoides]|uniref:hypothetical protein n=1 Tax=Bacillus mycoides TaxID=1405 RepID=UPI002E1FF509|nr:hypothetical protein [Bacillus mycoides]
MKVELSPSILLFWLKAKLETDGTMIKMVYPNTILGFIPVGQNKFSSPLNNVSSVNSSFKVFFGRLIFGIILLFLGMNYSLIISLIGIILLLTSVSVAIEVEPNSGKSRTIFVSVLEKQKLEEFIDFSEQKLHEKHM